MKTRYWIALGLVLAIGLAFVPVGGADVADKRTPKASPTIDLSSYSAESPPENKRPISIAFLHHSIGGQWLSEPGPEAGANCIYETHPNGGGLRALLEKNGYRVYEASYGSELGERTDLWDWAPKLAGQMDKILGLERQDAQHADGSRNRIVMFKSCFPNSLFVSEGEGEGNAAGPELTVANAKAALRAILPSLEKHPDVLFVYVTAPPVAPKLLSEPLWKWALKKVTGRGLSAASLKRSGALARKFNDWVKSPEGWLANYPHQNVAVFDFYDVLTQYGEIDFLAYPTEGGYDSHPSAEGNAKAAGAFVPFLNRAARRAGVF